MNTCETYDKLLFEDGQLHKTTKTINLNEYLVACIKLVDGDQKKFDCFKARILFKLFLDFKTLYVDEKIVTIAKVYETCFVDNENKNYKYAGIKNIREITLDDIFELFKATEKERKTFSQYVQYMHKDSKRQFLQSVFRGNRTYFEDFTNTTLEEFAEEVYKPTIGTLYKLFIERLGGEDKFTRRVIYREAFKINITKFNRLSIEKKREMVYNCFAKFVEKEDFAKHLNSSMSLEQVFGIL